MGPEGPVVIDFGIARALDSPGDRDRGGHGDARPTWRPSSWAAEVDARGRRVRLGRHDGVRRDGHPAFGPDSIPVVINRILNAEPDLGALEGALRELVAACLSKDPALRPTAEQSSAT